MYPRLTLARNLLREDGVIFISIDDNEVANLRKICDEVFGEENFVADLTWVTKTAPKGVPTRTMLVPNLEHVFVFKRSENFSFRGIPRDKNQFSNPDNDPRGAWKADNMKSTLSSAKVFTIQDPVTGNEYSNAWAFSKESIDRMITAGKVIFPAKPDGVPRQKRFMSEYLNENVPIVSHLDVFHTETATNQLKALFGETKVFDFPKPVPLLTQLVDQGSDPSALILDFFAGSGTTAQAVLEMNEEDGGNRKFILVQLPEVVDEDSAAAKAGFRNIAEITKERVRRVIKKLDGGTKDGLGLDGKKNLDRGFKVYALDRSNFVPWDATAATDAASLEKQLELAVDNVLHDRSDADLLAEILLKTGFPLDTVITKVEIAGTPVYQVADPGFLVCLAPKVDAPLIKAIAAAKPHRVVILDAAFQGNDALKTNAVQAFKDQGVEMFRTA